MTWALIVAGGLCGALGVVLAALGAHHPAGGNLGTAANFLMVHAPAFLALAALLRLNILPRRLVAAVAAVLGAGLALFCGDLALRAFTGARMFPGAAPAGGFLMIAGWTALAAGGFLARR